MDPPASIDQVKVEIRKFGGNLNRKCKVQAVINARMDLGYREDPEHDYSLTDYITR